MDWLRTASISPISAADLLLPEPAPDHGEYVAEMPDSETVCGCNGVTKGAIIQAIHQKGVRTLAQLKQCTRASTGCGSCSGTLRQPAQSRGAGFEEETKKVLCECVPFTQENLREIIVTQKLKSVQQVLDIYGNGKGCEICKPALSYLVDVSGAASTRRIARRVSSTTASTPTFRTTARSPSCRAFAAASRRPPNCARIADVAEKYNVRMVKITGSQRIDLLGVQKADLPKIWADLGMPSGQAYTKGVRMVKTCVGTEFCRFGVQDAIATGIELERRWRTCSRRTRPRSPSPAARATAPRRR